MEAIRKELCSEFIKKFPNMFTEDKEWWADTLTLLLERYDIRKNDLTKELRDALKDVKGVMPFHDGDFTLGEQNAMLKVDLALTKCDGKV